MTHIGRRLWPFILCSLACAAGAAAQTTWTTPPPNAPQVIVGYIHFHLALADAIKSGSASPSRDLSDAARETLGISAAEFDILTNGYRSALASAAAAPAVAPETALVPAFSNALAKISGKGAANVTAWMNGPFRAGMRTRRADGSAK